MKWIKYQIAQCTIDEEDILVAKKVGYSEENLVIAQKEAYNGEYQVIEDTTPEPQQYKIPTKLSELENDTNFVTNDHKHSEYLTQHQDVSGKLDKSGGTMTGKLKAASETTGAQVVRNIGYGSSVPSSLADGEIFVVVQ